MADLRLPDIDGLEVIKKAKGERPEVQVIIITGYGSVPSAVGAMKLGVVDYLSKPFTKNEFVDSVHGALKDTFAPMLKESAKKREVSRILERTAEERTFWLDLLQKGSPALGEYRISNEAKAAIVSGDLLWIREHVGELSDKQLRFILSRLEMENW